MKVRLTLFFILPFVLSSAISYSQNVVDQLQKYANNFNEERIYLHYDKSSYAPGETVWFKIYMMSAILPSSESKTVYVDYSDEKGNLLAHISAPVLEGASFGSYNIPDSFKGQYLHVKAYTRWMLNFDSAFLYNKDLKILNRTAKTASTVVEPKIAFFPEGGNLIAGLVNKVAFKVNDQFGKPLNVSGVIEDGSGKFIDSLRPLHDGMGFFYLSPAASAQFVARWKTDKGSQQSTKLPAVQETGIGIQIGILGDKRTFLIQSPDYGDGRELTVLGTMYKQPVFNFSRTLKDGATQGVIPTAELPSGIMTITIFDDHGKPLAERITYVNNEEYLFDAEMNVAHWGLNKRAKNELEITVPDSLVANLSIAVTDRGIDADTSENIISGLLLSGEIRGRINNPAYYFQNNSDSVLKNLDLVMLTHGWRKINWEKLSRNEMPEIKYPKDSGYLSFSGRIFGASPIQLRDAGSIVVLFNSKGNPNNIVNMPISPDGSFGDPNLILFDTTKVYYQLPKSKGLGDASVKFMQDRFPPLANTEKATGYFYNPLADTSGNHRHFLLADAAINDQRFSKAKTLETVTIKKREKSAVEVLDEKYASGMFSGADGYQFDVLNDPFSTASMNIFNYLQGKVPGLQVNTTSNPPTLVWRGGAPGIYLNEMPTDADMISTIPVSDVAYIKVLRPPFLGASGGGNGAIAIYTRKGGDVQQQPGKGLSNNTITGYTAIRQFYAPDYSTIQEGQDKRDLRTTLYWNPEIITEPGKNVFKLTFYNNDISEAFRVTIQGMTRDGRLTSVVKIME